MRRRRRTQELVNRMGMRGHEVGRGSRGERREAMQKRRARERRQLLGREGERGSDDGRGRPLIQTGGQVDGPPRGGGHGGVRSRGGDGVGVGGRERVAGVGGRGGRDRGDARVFGQDDGPADRRDSQRGNKYSRRIEQHCDPLARCRTPCPRDTGRQRSFILWEKSPLWGGIAARTFIIHLVVTRPTSGFEGDSRVAVGRP